MPKSLVADPCQRVLLINMGGPRSVAEIEPYLRRLFSDPYILPGNPIKRWLLSRVLARAAAPKSRARYEAIGGKSNAVEEAERLARQLEEHFAARGITLRCALAMRYGTPRIEQGLATLAWGGTDKPRAGTPARGLSVRTPGALHHGQGPALDTLCRERVLVRATPTPISYEDSAGPCHPPAVPGPCHPGPVTPVYLFPHETAAMTGSCAAILKRTAAKLGISVTPGVRHLGMTQTYARGWTEAIRHAVHEPKETFVLFPCHSLPLSIVERGDPYVAEVERSVDLIKSRLGDLACGLAYQSQERHDWLGPRVADKAAEAFAAGYRELIVVPLSFVGENTETVVDLDRDLRQAALALGFRRVERLPTPDRLGFLCPMVAEGLCQEWGLEC